MYEAHRRRYTRVVSRVCLTTIVVSFMLLLTWVTWASVASADAAVASTSQITEEYNNTGSVMSETDREATPTYTPTPFTSYNSSKIKSNSSATVLAASSRAPSNSSTENGKGSKNGSQVLVVCPAYSTPTIIPLKPNGQRELTNFYVWVDAGHGGDETGAVGQNNTYEKCWNLQIARDFGNILQSHGATVRYTRTDDTPVPIYTRTARNNAFYNSEPSANTSNYRFVSIHLNAPGVPTVPTTQPTNTPDRSINYTQVFYRCQTPVVAGIELAQTVSPRIQRVAQGSRNEAPPGDYAVLRCTVPGGYNILTESAFLTNPTVEARLQYELGFTYNLANEHYRSLVDFWLVGYDGAHQGRHPEIVKEYWNNINAGKDPGVPFSNGPQLYVHPWGYASTQEFVSPSGTTGSILECRTCPTPLPTPLNAATPQAYYVRNPIWSEYIEKNGPNTNGPGMPYGANGFEHIWPNAGRGVRGSSFYYPQVHNFERGAITYHDVEGTVFLPNCLADGVYNTWATPYAERMVRRFNISNDRPGPMSTPVGTSPTPTPLPPYNNSGLHLDDPATRAQVAQILMFAEGYPRYSGSNRFIDISNHWGKQWINNAAYLQIIGGYNDGTFRPDKTATRGQFTKMLVGARGWPTPTPQTQTFQDVPSSNAFYIYIEPAVTRGVIGGYPCGGPGEPCVAPNNRPYFRPDNEVTRAQIVKMVDVSVTCPNIPCGEPIACWR